MKRSGSILAAACIIVGLVFAATAAGMTGGSGGSTDATPASGVDQSSAIVQLVGDPISTYVKTKPTRGKKISFSNTNVKSYRAQLSALRNDFKQWLQTNAPAAKITGQFDISVNAVAVQLNGTSLDTLRSAPQVRAASYEALYYPTVDDPDLSLIHAFDAWSSGGGAAGAGAGVGAGVVVGVVDTGIDVTHPCFADSNSLNDGPYTNDKILSAAVFYNKAGQQALTPLAVQEHGTHVAGTIACDFNTPATVNGATIPYGISGVAPAAKLRSYNIFPGDVSNAHSEDILNALDAAAADGVDVINMSIGGGAHGVQDLVTNAVDNLDQANIVVAIAAGNTGPNHYTVESPGSAARALTAGAATVGHFVTATVSVGGQSFNAATGDFPTVSADTTLPLEAVTTAPVNVDSGLSLACGPVGVDLSGTIALISRGTCSFSQKVYYAQQAGASAVIVANNVAGDPIAMGLTAGFPPPPPPAYMVSLADGTAMKAFSGTLATIPVAQTYVQTGKDDIMAGFSSQGPTDVDFRVKPDVVAPGVNVLSSIPVSFCGGAPCFAFFQGTSMATPHLAGSAAVVLSQHPAWSAVQVRSSIVNTADQGVLTKSDGTGFATDVNVIGAGRENLASAVNASVGLDPVSVSFGSVPAGAGQSGSVQVALSTLDGGAGSYTASVTDQTGGGVAFGASISGSGATVTMVSSKPATPGDYQGILRIYRGDTEVAHAAVYAFVKQGSK